MRAIMLAAGVAAGPLWSLPVLALDQFPFNITWSGGQHLAIKCHGPWLRESACASIGPQEEESREFYRADNYNWPSAVGEWVCDVVSNYNTCVDSIARVKFCGPKIIDTDPARFDRANRVELTFDGTNLTADQPARCPGATLTGVLGQDGESSPTPAQDLDTYTFAGKPGENVRINLGRDGSSGSAGRSAALIVRSPAGAVLGQRTGSVPLSLELTLPGPIEVAVRRRLADGDPFRGSYTLEVAPESGDVGARQLNPTEDVEQ